MKERAECGADLASNQSIKSDPGDPLLVTASFDPAQNALSISALPPPSRFCSVVTCIERFLCPDHRDGRLDAQRADFDFISPKSARSFPSSLHFSLLASCAPHFCPTRSLHLRDARSCLSATVVYSVFFTFPNLPRLSALRSVATPSHFGPHYRLRPLRCFCPSVSTTHATNRLGLVLRIIFFPGLYALHVPSILLFTYYERYQHMHCLFTILHPSQSDRLPFQEITTC